ncbi:MAG: hypothetical protein AAF648_04845 [Pseudomonadota bacterium]
MLIGVYERIALLIGGQTKLLLIAAAICFAIPLTSVGAIISGEQRPGAIFSLFGSGLILWGLQMCSSWYHPSTGSMRIGDGVAVSGFREIMRELTASFLFIYFLGGLALLILPLRW